MASKFFSQLREKPPGQEQEPEIDPRPDSPQSDYEGDDSDALALGNSSSDESGDDSGPYVYHIKMELQAASNLPAGGLTQTVDPYAVITCGADKLFSSVAPGTRDPMWGEEFDFYSESLPVSLHVSVYDWDILRKSSSLGSATVNVREEGEAEVAWLPLGADAGQVCVQIQTAHVQGNDGRLRRLTGSAEDTDPVNSQGLATEVCPKPGPLQDIFELPFDEILLSSFSCSLERSFLYHGRMYVSPRHLAFHSNAFQKKSRTVIPIEDIEEVRKSAHALINPAITIVLRAGSGGHGVPPLATSEGRPKYKFTSFWNRGHVYKKVKALVEEQETQNKDKMKMKKKGVSSDKGTPTHAPAPVEKAAPTPQEGVGAEEGLAGLVAGEGEGQGEGEGEPFLDDSVLREVLQDELHCSPSDYFSSLHSSSSSFLSLYRGHRKDTEVEVEEWEKAGGETGGVLRKVTFRALCHSPMCPSTTSMTEYQRAIESAAKDVLTFELIQQAHDVPYGSYFEVHARWRVERKVGEEHVSCITLLMGVHFKKHCFMEGKIKSGAAKEYKEDAMLLLDLAKNYLENKGKETGDGGPATPVGEEVSKENVTRGDDS